MTAALGEYARMISDFSILPTNPNLGRVGSYWYLEHLDAYFDDSDHYRMIKAMCSCLSRNVCDKIDHSNCRPKAAHDKFKSLVQLESHLFHKHRLFMCPLCLERKKVFISEQKLYTRAQLNIQVDTGDFEADGGDLFERGGFIGHHKCEFCKKAFYGNSELCSHMEDPEQCQQYKDYDDLEKHFDERHFLCEEGDCCAKKFIVFSSECKLKNMIKKDHGGLMSQITIDSKVCDGSTNDAMAILAPQFSPAAFFLSINHHLLIQVLEKYGAFNCITAGFREGVTSAAEYLGYVGQFGLSHLVSEPARVCPDLLKQKELPDTYNYNANFRPLPSKERNTSSRKGKEKCEAVAAADDEEEEEERDSKSQVVVAGGCSSSSSSDVEGNQRKRKTTTKIIRFGDGSMGALLDLKHSGEDVDLIAGKTLLLRGVWRQGGGQRLVAMTQVVQ
ncbi:unnamed protein product [Camellia sinensis]